MAALQLVLLLILAVLISAVIDQIVPKLSSPLIQIALGFIIALIIPGQIDIPFDSELFLVLFVAPILYDEARTADKAALFQLKWPIISLAIGLVIITMIGIGFAVNLLIPSIPLAAALALGAALGPTDAIAVSSLPKDVQLGSRRRGILQGEYLINDASGIVGFQFAIAAAVTGTYSITQGITSFLVCFFGGIIVGAVLGFVFNFIEERVRGLGLENTTFHVLFDIFTPFIMYLAAEPFGASGIIAVVVGGFVRALATQAIGPQHSRLSIVASSTWRVLSFTLNGIVFVLLGTQLPKAMTHIWGDITIPNGALILYVLAITVILMGVRFIWLLFTEYAHNRHEGTKLFSKPNALSSWLMTLAGPKGAVTLAVVLTTPLLASSGSFFPQRELIIFLACGVILVTLLMSNFLLPLFAPKRDVAKDEAEALETEIDATLETLRTVIQELSARETPENRRAIGSVIMQYNERIDKLKDRHDIGTGPNIAFRLKTMQWERDFVTKLIEDGEVEPLIGYEYLNRLARTEGMLTHRTRFETVRDAVRQVFAGIRSGINTIKRKMPFMSESEKSAALREVQIRVIQKMLTKLQDELYEGSTPSEDVSRLIFEYQRTLNSLRLRMSRVEAGVRGAFNRPADLTTDVERTALAIEMETIQNMYDEGRITRAMANRMRERVLLMQVDLENNV